MFFFLSFSLRKRPRSRLKEVRPKGGVLSRSWSVTQTKLDSQVEPHRRSGGANTDYHYYYYDIAATNGSQKKSANIDFSGMDVTHALHYITLLLPTSGYIALASRIIVSIRWKSGF